MSKLETEPAPIIEPEHIRDDYTTDFADIEAVGPCARFTMLVESRSPIETDELLVVRKLMIPIDCLQGMIDRTQAFLDNWRQSQMSRAAGVLN